MLNEVRRWLFLVLAVTLPAAAARAQDEAAREKREKVSEIFEAMAVRPGAVVADVGAGGGFLTVRLARAVGEEGRVLAVDINPRVIERLRARVDKEGLANVHVIEGNVDDPHLPRSSLDAAVIVNSYHEMTSYHAMLDHLRNALKPDGRLVIVEPLSEKRRNGSRDEQTRAHEIAPGFVEQDMREAGFRIVRLEDPFATRNSDVMWLLVATPDPLAAKHPAVCPLPRKNTTPAAPAGSADDDAALSSPDLRMAFDRFKQLREAGAIVVLDVRSEEEFQSGHVPGALWIPLDRVREHTAELRAHGKPIVTYCS